MISNTTTLTKARRILQYWSYEQMLLNTPLRPGMQTSMIQLHLTYQIMYLHAIVVPLRLKLNYLQPPKDQLQFSRKTELITKTM
jgi:hypothetical protein